MSGKPSERRTVAPPASESSSPVIHTIGHSTRSLDELIGLLRAHGVDTLVDIRSFPGSRRYPHFNAANLAVELPEQGIAYVSMKELGGRRRGRSDSINAGWRHPAFRGYADYMATPEFRAGLDRLETLCRDQVCAIMCSEAVPWKCHRNLVSDALVLLKGIPVRHIMDDSSARPHVPAPFARVEGDHLIYPGDHSGEFEFAG